MPSTHTTNLGIEKPADGEQAGTWGQTVNKDFDFFDTGIDGSISIPLSTSGYTLLTTPGVASTLDGRNKVVVFTGAITGDANILIRPDTAKKIYFVSNKTDGGFALNFSQGASSPPFRLAWGYSAIICADGGGAAANVVGVIADLQVASLLVMNSLKVNGTLSFAGAQTITTPVTFSGGVTISAPLKLNLGGDVDSDMYYRSGGNVARLPIGGLGYFLSAGAAGPAWVLPPQATVGVPVGGAVQDGGIFYANGVLLSQDPNLKWLATVGMGIGRAPGGGSGLAVGGSIAPVILLDGAVGGQSSLVYATAGLKRWAWELLGAEAAGDAGSDMVLHSYSNAGIPTATGTPIRVVRANGHVCLGRPSDLGGGTVNMANVPTVTADTTLVVQAVPGQTGYMQEWRNSGGLRVASIDAAGNFYSAGGSFLSLDANRRLDINGAAASGHPQGTLHIGADAVGQNPSIVLEDTPGAPNALGTGCRIYIRRGGGAIKFVIQFMNSGGTISYTWVDLNLGIGGNPSFSAINSTAP